MGEGFGPLRESAAGRQPRGDHVQRNCCAPRGRVESRACAARRGNKIPSSRRTGWTPDHTHRGCRRNRPSCGESAGLGAQRGGHFIQRTEWPPLSLTCSLSTSPGAAPSLRFRGLPVRPSGHAGSVSRRSPGHSRRRASPLRRLPGLPPRQQQPRAPRPAPAPARSGSSAPRARRHASDSAPM